MTVCLCKPSVSLVVRLLKSRDELTLDSTSCIAVPFTQSEVSSGNDLGFCASCCMTSSAPLMSSNACRAVGLNRPFGTNVGVSHKNHEHLLWTQNNRPQRPQNGTSNFGKPPCANHTFGLPAASPVGRLTTTDWRFLPTLIGSQQGPSNTHPRSTALIAPSSPKKLLTALEYSPKQLFTALNCLFEGPPIGSYEVLHVQTAAQDLPCWPRRGEGVQALRCKKVRGHLGF